MQYIVTLGVIALVVVFFVVVAALLMAIDYVVRRLIHK